jgi:purine-nucleoside phosphorylase
VTSGIRGGGSAAERPFPLEEAGAYLQERISVKPEVFLVLGSGLGGVAEGLEDPVSVPFADVPGFPDAGVVGHAGTFLSGSLEGRRALVQSGRFHFYEGHPASLVVAPIRLAASLGARFAIVTNAAGGIRSDLSPGSILLLDDHLNLQDRSPLAGAVEDDEQRFPDLSAPYDPGLQKLVLEVAAGLEIPLSRGTYAALLGPSYETPAEVRYFRECGADAVGMSTVPEVIVARARGLRVLAFSLITNLAPGLAPGVLDHQEVLDMGRLVGDRLTRLIREVVARLPGEEPGEEA